MTDTSTTAEPSLINVYEGEVAFSREYASRVRGTDVNRHNRFRVKVPEETKERDVSIEIGTEHSLTFNRGDRVTLIYSREDNGSDDDLMAVYNETVDSFWITSNPSHMFFWLTVAAAGLAYFYADHWGWYIPAVVLGVIWLGGSLPARDAALEYIGQQRIDRGLCEAPADET